MLFRSVAILAAALVPTSLSAQGPAPVAAIASPASEAIGQSIVAVLRGQQKPEAVFGPEFLAAIPPAQVAGLAKQLEAQFGLLVGVESITPMQNGGATIRLRFEKAIVGGPIAVNSAGKVVNLVLNDIVPVGDSLAKIENELKALPGAVGVYYGPLEKGPPVLAINPDQQFALGSAFKLYVLSTLAREVQAGKRRWSDVVTLDDVRSLPSGMVQNWPRNAPVTLHTLATMMISISDNTATDQLIHLLGRQAIASELRSSGHSSPDRTLPFLTTRELFTLKSDAARGAAYAALPENRQGTALDALAKEIAANPDTLPRPDFSQPNMIDTLEWFASPTDSVRLLARLAALSDPTAREIMAVSPSMPEADRKGYSYVGFKGGSETGVLNLTWLLRPAGTNAPWRVLTMGWNDPAHAVDEKTFEMLAVRLLKLAP